MTDAYKDALKVARSLSNDKKLLGKLLDKSNATIRDFSIEVDGNLDREDSYGRYRTAGRFLNRLGDSPQYADMIKRLDYSYFFWAQKALEQDAEFEDLVDTLMTCDGRLRIEDFKEEIGILKIEKTLREKRDWYMKHLEHDLIKNIRLDVDETWAAKVARAARLLRGRLADMPE